MDFAYVIVVRRRPSTVLMGALSMYGVQEERAVGVYVHKHGKNAGLPRPSKRCLRRSHGYGEKREVRTAGFAMDMTLACFRRNPYCACHWQAVSSARVAASGEGHWDRS